MQLQAWIQFNAIFNNKTAQRWNSDKKRDPNFISLLVCAKSS